MIEPELLCNKHLLGEHGEIHKHKHNFQKKHSIKGRIFPIVQIEPASMELRHNALAVEMIKRGMNHKSDYSMPDISYLPEQSRNAIVNVSTSKHDLSFRCLECSKRIKELDK